MPVLREWDEHCEKWVRASSCELENEADSTYTCHNRVGGTFASFFVSIFAELQEVADSATEPLF